MRYTDPEGHIFFLAVPLITGGIGALAGAAGSFISQMAQGEGSFSERLEDVDWGNVGIAAGVGFVAGALAPVVATSPVGAVALGATANTAQYALTQWSNDDPITTGGLLLSAGSGAVAGGVMGPVSKPTDKLLFDTTSPFLDKGVAEACNAGLQLAPVVARSNLVRSGLGGWVSNWDWSSWDKH